MTKKDKENTRHYRVSHQILSLTGINFQTKSIIGCVEITLIPSRDHLKYIRLNAKQLRIYSVCLNNTIDAPFQYFDPTLEVCQNREQDERRDLDFFTENHLSGCNLVDPDLNGGEINIKVPSEAFNQNMIGEGKPLKVRVEFSLEDPKGGVQFVIPDGDGSMGDRSAHMYSFGHENSARLWFPCVDTTSEPCTWKLEFTVDEGMTAVSCGELYDTVYTPDMRRKTFHYHVNTPTAAPNIALAVGPFQIYVDPNMPEMIHFCLPHMLPVLKSTVRYQYEVFEYFETILGSPFPFTSYKQVFVDELYPWLCSYSSLSLINTNILHPTAVIDAQYETRKLLTEAVATQFFGSYVSTEKWSDRWIKKGIPKYLMGLWVRKTFGNNEYRDMMHQAMYEVTSYESKIGGIILDSSQVPVNNVTIKGEASRNPEIETNAFCFPVKNLQTCSPEYLEIMDKKAHLVIRMLEHRLGQQQLLQVLNKLLALATNAKQSKNDPKAWSNHMVWNTVSFTKLVLSVTGKETAVFMDQWVRMGGHAKFQLKFVFNRKRNTVELTINQEAADKYETGVRKYVGPVRISLQELDGQFVHNFQVESVNSKHDITCHSKSRRNKKKKIPLANNEEVDMDLSQMDDSPVLWIRLDPDMTLIRSLDIIQPDFQWQYQLRHERDVTAQTEAVYALEGYPSQTTRSALEDTIKNDQCFYKVRCRATECLTAVANATVQWDGPPAMMLIFKNMFGSFAVGHIIKQNDFSNLQNYFLQCAIPVAMGGLRNSHQICPAEVLEFLLNLFKYNDNTKNSFSDNYYRAALVTALGKTVTPVISMVGQGPITSESLAEDTKKVLEEITRYLNMEKLLPCYRYTVTVACLKAIRKLQKTGHLPPNPDFFKDYSQYGQYQDVRLAALECLVDYVRHEGQFSDIIYLIDMIEEDKDPQIRHKLSRMIVDNPPFEKNKSHRNNKKDLVERLWSVINSKFWYDSRLRCDMVDLYYTLYGRRKPFCLGGFLGELGILPPNQLMPGNQVPMPNWNKQQKFTIPKTEKKEIKKEVETGSVQQQPVQIKQEPGTFKIKQEKQDVDDRDNIMSSSEVPDFFMDPSPSPLQAPPREFPGFMQPPPLGHNYPPLHQGVGGAGLHPPPHQQGVGGASLQHISQSFHPAGQQQHQLHQQHQQQQQLGGPPQPQFQPPQPHGPPGGSGSLEPWDFDGASGSSKKKHKKEKKKKKKHKRHKDERGEPAALGEVRAMAGVGEEGSRPSSAGSGTSGSNPVSPAAGPGIEF